MQKVSGKLHQLGGRRVQKWKELMVPPAKLVFNKQSVLGIEENHPVGQLLDEPNVRAKKDQRKACFPLARLTSPTS